MRAFRRRDQRKVVLIVQIADAADTLHRRLLADLTTQGVGGVGRIDDHATVQDDVDGASNQARLGGFGMNLKELGHVGNGLQVSGGNGLRQAYGIPIGPDRNAALR